MLGDDDLDLSMHIALVLDENPYARSISLDQLRSMGFGRALGAETLSEAWDLILRVNPSVILMEWMGGVGQGLDFVRRIRASEELPNRAAPLFMLTAQGGLADIERARLAGADGFLRKPISALTLKKRVRRALVNPQPFVATAGYVGPCRRRRRSNPDFSGPWRRMDDAPPKNEVPGDEDVLDLKAEIARARVAALEAAVKGLAPGDANAARGVFKAVQALVEASEQMGDQVLALGAKEMARYLQAQGATDRLDPEIVQTHVAALHQLVSLPHSFATERDKIGQSLKRMIDKKLRQANAA